MFLKGARLTCHVLISSFVKLIRSCEFNALCFNIHVIMINIVLLFLVYIIVTLVLAIIFVYIIVTLFY